MGMGLFKIQVGRTVLVGEGMGGRVWQAEQPVIVEDYRTWPHRIPDKVFDCIRSIVGIPLKSEQNVLGVIGLAHVEGQKRFDKEDIAALERFAALALIALEKAQLYADARHELAERKRTESSFRRSSQG